VSAILPGVTRKIMDFNTGKQANPIEFPPNNWSARPPIRSTSCC